MEIKTFKLGMAGFLLPLLSGCSTHFLVPQKTFYETVNVALWVPTKFENLEISRPIKSEVVDFTEKILAPKIRDTQNFRIIQGADDADGVKNADCLMFINYKRGVETRTSGSSSSGGGLSVSVQTTRYIPTLAIYVKIKEKNTDAVLYYKEINIHKISKYTVEELFKEEKFRRKWEKIVSEVLLEDFIPRQMHSLRDERF